MKKKKEYIHLYGEYYEYKLFGFIPIILNPKNMIFVDKKRYIEYSVYQDWQCKRKLKIALSRKDQKKYENFISNMIKKDLPMIRNFVYKTGLRGI